jgi:hypothetical protein
MLDAARVTSATGSAETILHIPVVGRYSLTAESPTGASLELVDRMRGTNASAQPESAGTDSSGRMSRIDTFLEPGDYKVRVAHARGETVRLRVQRFESGNTGKEGSAVPLLPNGSTSSGELHDLELFSYWIVVDAGSTPLLVEARGRSLRDMVLWKDGVWDTGVHPMASTLEREPGKPVTVLEMNAQLEPGAYLLSCAGGPRAQWAQESDASPFSITRGASFLGELGRMSVTLPVQETASFIVSGSVSTFEMQARNANSYRLIVSRFSPGRSRYESARQTGITSKSASLRCSVNGATGASTSWVTVQGPAGQTVDLAWLGGTESRGGSAQQPFRGSADYLTSILSSMEGDDSIDATGMILQVGNKGGKTTLETLAMQTVTVSPDQPLHRTVNCMGPLSFILQPQKRGTYSVAEKDPNAASALYSFRLLDDQFISSGVQPIQVKGGGRLELLEKLYYVTISPVKAGVLEFAIVPSNLLGRPKTGDVFSSPAPAPRNDIFWPSTTIVQSSALQTYLILGQRSGVAQGLTVRQLPAELEQVIPLRVDPGLTISFSFVTKNDVLLSSTNAAFTPANALIDTIPWRPDRIIPRGVHTCSITNRSSQPQWHVVTGAPPDASINAPLPVVADPETLFPSLSEGSIAWKSFERLQTVSYLLKVKEPASYRISTAGRLAMGILIRTPLTLSLLAASENVDGRNADLTAYLRPGTYMVQVATHGSSMGRAGVLLQRVPVVQAGSIRDGETLRSSVPGGQPLQTDVVVDQEGDYSLECLGLSRSFPYRLEDEDGWPIGAPIRNGSLSEHLAAGKYHYISLADREKTRRIIALRAVGGPPAPDSGAKRVSLALNQTYRRTWSEQEGRPPDVFTFTLASEIQATFSLSTGMLYRITDAGGAPLSDGVGGKSLPLRLHAGDWRIELTSLQEDNQKQYQISLTTEDLFVGAVRRLSQTPGVLPVTIGAAGTVEIWSYGGNELDAVLADESGRIVAQSETIANDWNFRILSGVQPGRYQLRYTSPLFASAQRLGSESTVRMIAREERAVAAVTGSLSTRVDLAQEIAVVPFTSGEGGVYRVTGQSPTPVSVAIVREGKVLASGMSPLLFPFARDGRYTLRFWRMSEKRAAVTLLAGLERALDAASDGALDVGATALHLVFPAGTSFRVESDGGQLLYATASDHAFTPLGDAAVSTADGSGWVVRPDGAALGACRITSLSLTDAAAVGVMVGDAEGGFLVRVPTRTMALVSTENAGKPVGLSVAPQSAGRQEGFDWRGALVGPRVSLIGLREGVYRGRLWATGSGDRASRRVIVSTSLFPIVTEAVLGKEDRTFSVPPLSAVSLSLAGGQSAVEVSMERGMAAIAWSNGPAGAVDAPDSPRTGVLDAPGGSIVVVNRTKVPGMCSLRAAAPAASIELTEGTGFESVVAGDKPLTFVTRSVRAPSHLYLWGAYGRVRFVSQEDGRISEGETVDTGLGSVLAFPAQKGRLEVEATSGPLKAWIAAPDLARSVFAARDSFARQSALSPEGGILQPTQQAWTFALEVDSIVSLRADGDGVMGVFDRSGACVKATAGTGGRSILAMIPRGSYTLLTRPFANTTSVGGLVTLRPLMTVPLATDGEGAPVLIGPHDQVLYRFMVSAAGKVGCGIRAQSETLAATLFDARFTPIDTGRIFIRDLAPGPYYLLVSSNGETQRYAPVVFGLEGDQTQIPDSVLKSYRGE